MHVLDMLKRLPEDGASRLADALSDLPLPWNNRRRRSRLLKRVLWATGFAIGILVIAAAIWSTWCREARDEMDEAEYLS